MIIAIIDLPSRDHSSTVNELLKHHIPLLKGTIEELQNQSEKLIKAKNKQIIIWDYPSLIEDGHIEKVDKILTMIHFNQTLTPDERKIEKQREIIKTPAYLLGEPCKVRDNTEEKFQRTLGHCEETIQKFITHWQKELNDSLELTDENLLHLSTEMLRNADMDVDLFIHNNLNIPYSARYLSWLNRIVLNPIKMPNSFNAGMLVMAHEMGHAVDPDLPALEEKEKVIEGKLREAATENEIEDLIVQLEQIILKQEDNAYNHCYKFLPKNYIKEHVEADRLRNAAGYKQILKRTQKKYIELLKRKGK